LRMPNTRIAFPNPALRAPAPSIATVAPASSHEKMLSEPPLGAFTKSREPDPAYRR
jgi:hypothetical protein